MASAGVSSRRRQSPSLQLEHQERPRGRPGSTHRTLDSLSSPDPVVSCLSRRVGVGWQAGSASPWLAAYAAISARLETPSLSKMLVMWCLTVSSARPSRAATSRFDSPAATAATISRSRAVSRSAGDGRRRATAAARSRRWRTMSVTVSRPTQYWPATTLRIALKRSSVAASLRTTPRAPSSSASTTCASSIATVSSSTFGPVAGRGQLPKGVEARGPGHREVEQQDVGLHLAREAHGLEAVRTPGPPPRSPRRPRAGAAAPRGGWGGRRRSPRGWARSAALIGPPAGGGSRAVPRPRET